MSECGKGIYFLSFSALPSLLLTFPSLPSLAVSSSFLPQRELFSKNHITREIDDTEKFLRQQDIAPSRAHLLPILFCGRERERMMMISSSSPDPWKRRPLHWQIVRLSFFFNVEVSIAQQKRSQELVSSSGTNGRTVDGSRRKKKKKCCPNYRVEKQHEIEGGRTDGRAESQGGEVSVLGRGDEKKRPATGWLIHLFSSFSLFCRGEIELLDSLLFPPRSEQEPALLSPLSLSSIIGWLLQPILLLPPGRVLPMVKTISRRSIREREESFQKGRMRRE